MGTSWPHLLRPVPHRLCSASLRPCCCLNLPLPSPPPHTPVCCAVPCCNQVEVVHVSDSARYTFNCHNWIDKKSNWQRVLTAMKA